MRFLAYILGSLILIAGLAWAATEAGVPQLYIVIGAIILFGLGIMTAATSTRRMRGTGGVTVVHDDDVL